MSLLTCMTIYLRALAYFEPLVILKLLKRFFRMTQLFLIVLCFLNIQLCLLFMNVHMCTFINIIFQAKAKRNTIFYAIQVSGFITSTSIKQQSCQFHRSFKSLSANSILFCSPSTIHSPLLPQISSFPYLFNSKTSQFLKAIFHFDYLKTNVETLHRLVEV